MNFRTLRHACLWFGVGCGGEGYVCNGAANCECGAVFGSEKSAITGISERDRTGQGLERGKAASVVDFFSVQFLFRASWPNRQADVSRRQEKYNTFSPFTNCSSPEILAPRTHWVRNQNIRIGDLPSRTRGQSSSTSRSRYRSLYHSLRGDA